MSELKHRLLSPEQLALLIKSAPLLEEKPIYLREKHQLIYESEALPILKFRLPLHCSWKENQQLEEEEERPFLILMIDSGQAALAYGEGVHIVEHKVFKSYMVRKKQGKSQLKYLKTKGKSKAGSRVRLANTVHFFEEIQEKVAEWLSYFEVEYIALSCSKSLYPHLFNEAFDLDKHDARIVKIPKHIQEANFDKLLEIHRYLLKAEVIYEEADEERINGMLLVE